MGLLGAWLFLSLCLIYLNAPFHAFLVIYLFLRFFLNFVPDFHLFFSLSVLELSPPGKFLNSLGSLYFLGSFLVSLI